MCDIDTNSIHIQRIDNVPRLKQVSSLMKDGGGQPQVFPETSSGQYGYSNLMLLLL